jgi:hypothetical protein
MVLASEFIIYFLDIHRIISIFYFMKNIFFNIEDLHLANNLMNNFIKDEYAEMAEKKVSPHVKPGFLRKELPISPPT